MISHSELRMVEFDGHEHGILQNFLCKLWALVMKWLKWWCVG